MNHILEKNPTTCSIGQDRRVKGADGSQRAVDIMIIGGFLTSA